MLVPLLGVCVQVDGRRRARKASSSAGTGRKRKRAHIVELHGWEWDPTELFEIERLIGRMVSDGVTPVPGREGEQFEAGTVLYRVLWERWPPEIATWEEEDQIPWGGVDFVAACEEELEKEAVGDVEEDEGGECSDMDEIDAV